MTDEVKSLPKHDMPFSVVDALKADGVVDLLAAK